MAEMKRLRIAIPGQETVSALLEEPEGDETVAAATLAHGAGAGMEHPFLQKLSSALVARKLAILRFQFPYWERGGKRTDPPKIAVATIAAALETLGKHVPGLPLFASGKSFGARMSTTASAQGAIPEARGIVCYGFPLHQAGEPGLSRAEHLRKLGVPLLLLQGTRDALASFELISKVAGALPQAKLVRVEGADHGFAVLKRSGRSADEVIEQLASETLAFVSAQL